MKVNVDVSIIIPCYNHGVFIRDAVCSIFGISNLNYEIIIVNDGSTDSFTLEVLSELEKEGCLVIHQKNYGLGAARNAGIKQSQGKYILPLDADNRIKSDYILKAYCIMENNKADIVYGEPEFFGEVNSLRLFHPKEFDINDLFFGNYIDACAVYRKSVWELTGGYETNMPFPGHEDWEFWIHAYKKDFKFKFLKEKLFYYRIVSNSMIVSTTNEDKEYLNHKFIVYKHFDVFLSLNAHYTKLLKVRSTELKNPFRTAIKFFQIWLRIKK